MKRLFGQKKAEAPAPTLGEAGAKLDARQAVIDEKCKKLDAELLQLREQIQKSRGPAQERLKQRALQVLKQKKMYDSQRDQLYQQQYSMEQLAFTTEMMADTKLQVEAMKASSKQLSAHFKKFSVDEVERMQDELADLYEMHQEVQEVMGRAYGVPDDVDEDMLADELDALAFDMEKEKDAAYLDAALATPAGRLPDAAVPGDRVPEAPRLEATDPMGLEAQLGL